jgi:hypothetical protein
MVKSVKVLNAQHRASGLPEIGIGIGLIWPTPSKCPSISWPASTNAAAR